MQQYVNPKSELNFTPEDYKNLNEAAKWSKFLSIIGFILLGISLLMNFFSMAFSISTPSPFSKYGGSGFAFLPFLFSFITIFIYYFPIAYLYRFAVEMKSALSSNDQMEINSAFKNLKSHYKFFILFVLFLVFGYILFRTIMSKFIM